MKTAPVSPPKLRELTARMARLGVREEDLEERFVLGSGRGGQKVNKTASCVMLRHGPSGIEVRCGAERSQALNRFLARRRLCERLEARIAGARDARAAEAARERRRKARRSRRQKARMVAEKRLHGRKKEARRTPEIEP